MKVSDLDGVHPDVKQWHVNEAVQLARKHSPAAPECQPDTIKELAEAAAGVECRLSFTGPERPKI